MVLITVIRHLEPGTEALQLFTLLALAMNQSISVRIEFPDIHCDALIRETFATPPSYVLPELAETSSEIAGDLAKHRRPRAELDRSSKGDGEAQEQSIT